MTANEVLLDYVLGQLSTAERTEIETRLDDDAELRAELAAVRTVVDLLAYASVATPPPELRALVLQDAAARRDAELAYAFSRDAPRQVPPDGTDGETAHTLASAVDDLAFASATAPPPGLRQRVLSAAAATRPSPARANTRRVPWSTLAAVAASLLAVFFGWRNGELRRELGVERELARLIQEPNVVHRFALAGNDRATAASGGVTLDMDGQKGAIVITGGVPTTAGQVYRLWARVGADDVYCADLVPSPQGDVAAVFRVPVDSYTAPIAFMYVTLEDKDAPLVPSGPRILVSA